MAVGHFLSTLLLEKELLEANYISARGRPLRPIPVVTSDGLAGFD